MTAKSRTVRVSVVVAGGIAVWLFLLVSLFRIQVVKHTHYNTLASRQHEKPVEVPARRGNVFDRNEELLVGSSSAPSIIANPSQIEEASAVGRTLASILQCDRRTLTRRLREDREFLYVERKVAPAVWSQIEEASLPGVYSVLERDRVYPYGDLASHILGRTNIDNVGIEGIERQYDEYLRGTPGWRVLQKVPTRGSRPVAGSPFMAPRDGSDIELTIDVGLQGSAEMELEKALARTDAQWGMVLAMEPSTGEILAMTEKTGPRFRSKDGAAMNHCLSAQFEPGSTFKIVAFAAALEQGVVELDQIFDAGGGKYDFGFYKLRDSKEHDSLSVREAFWYSSNIVTAQIANLLGKQNLYRYARKFGFGSISGIDLPGEVAGILRKPVEWSGRSLGTIAIGHEMTVNLVQLVSAFAAIANGGMLMEPHVVREIRDADGHPVFQAEPTAIRRVLRPETAATLRDLLAGVVREGTSKQAALDRWDAAGKSGTAQMLNDDGTFSNRNYVSSFVGFVPAGNPKIALAVVLVDPTGVSAGGVIAGPVFRDILTRAATSMHSDPFADVRRKEAIRTWIASTEAGEPASLGAAPIVPSGTMPDVTGLTIREARRLMLANGVPVSCQGVGTVTAQEPKPGADIAGTSLCILKGVDL